MNKSDYLLTLIGEEALEIAHQVSKALRFGLNEIQPGQQFSNAERIESEINDFVAVLELFHNEEPLFRISTDRLKVEKHKVQVLRFMEYSKQCGRLDL